MYSVALPPSLMIFFIFVFLLVMSSLLIQLSVSRQPHLDTNQPFLSSPLLSGLPKYQHTHDAEKKKFQLSFYRPTFVFILLKLRFSCSQRKLSSFAFPGIIFAKSFLSSDSVCEEVLDPSLEELEPSQFSFY